MESLFVVKAGHKICINRLRIDPVVIITKPTILCLN